MKYRKIGKTNLNASVIGIGTDQFSGDWGVKFSKNEVKRILDRANQLGINFLDTAECYGDHLSESLIGNAIKENRDEWIIATKFGHNYFGKNNQNVDFSPKGVEVQLEKSLKALKTDHIDIYQFHSGTNDQFDQMDLWDLLKKQVKAGKIKHLGLSIVNSAVLEDDLHQLQNIQDKDVQTIQVVYNRLNHKASEKIIPYCVKHNIGIIGRVPLAKGHLTGKYKPDKVFPKEDKRYLEDKVQTARQLEIVQKIKVNEVPDKVNMTQWALAWCLKNPLISTIIPGCKNLEQLEINAKSVELI